MKRRLTYVFAPVLAALVIASTAACDTTGTETESDFTFFANGTWRVTSVRTNKDADLGDPGDITFRFFESDGLKRFSVSGKKSNGEHVDIEGTVAFGFGSEFQLVSEDFSGVAAVEVRYDIKGSARLALYPRENGGVLVGMLFGPNLSNVTITLERQ